MTDKQIKKDAHKAARKLNHGEPDIYRKGYEEGYIVGVHSYDEEIERLEKALSTAQKEIAKLVKLYKKGE